MSASLVRVHDCFDVLAGESKPPKCNCPHRISHEKAQELIDSGKAKRLNSRSMSVDGRLTYISWPITTPMKQDSMFRGLNLKTWSLASLAS